MTDAVVLPFAPAAERRRNRRHADALEGRPLWRIRKDGKAHAIRWTYPPVGQRTTSWCILRCGKTVVDVALLERAGTDAPVCSRCAASTVEDAP